MEINVALFERMMKNIILLEYESVLPKEKKLSIKDKKIMDNNSSLDENSFQCEIIRSIFKNLIDVTCIKIIDVQGEMREIPYGEYFNNGIIEYYTFLICNKYSAEYNMDVRYLDGFEFVKDLSNVINLDNFVFSKDASEILGQFGLDKFRNKCDMIAAESYLLSFRERSIKDEDNLGSLVYNVNENDSLAYIVYKENEMIIRYYDNATYSVIFDEAYDAEVFLIYKDLLNNKKLTISNFISKLERRGIIYRIINEDAPADGINFNVSNKEIDDEHFISFDTKEISSISVEQISDYEARKNNISEVDEDTSSLDDVISEIEQSINEIEEMTLENPNRELNIVDEISKKEEVIPESSNENEKIISKSVDEVIEKNEEVTHKVTREVTQDNVEETINEVTSKNKDSKDISIESENSVVISSDDIITEAEYEKLCMKAIKNKEITPEEYKKMEIFDKYYYGDSSDLSVVNNKVTINVNSNKDTQNNNNIKEKELVKENDKNVINAQKNEVILEHKRSTSFGKKALIIIVGFIFILCIGIFLGSLLFKLKS